MVNLVLLGLLAVAQQVVFREARSGSGIDYVNVSGEKEKLHILSTLGSGIALLDYDEDGDLDVYLVNGATLHLEGIEENATNRLYRNEGPFSFRDVTEQAGLAGEGWGFGAAAGDYDNDGLVDLYVTNLGANLLYRNRGDGSFVELGRHSGVADPHWGTSAAFFDADRDGDSDLYVCNYVEIGPDELISWRDGARCQWFGLQVMCGPRGLAGAGNVFYSNQGDGSFVDATKASGLEDSTGAYSLGVVAGDYDDDGDSDLYVANDSVPNFLYQNDGRGRFREVAFLSGVALSEEGLAQAGMGVDLGDLDGDGSLDLFVTNFSHEANSLYMNQGRGAFVDSVAQSGLHEPSWFSLGWGTRFVDLDHDTDLDVFVANGHVYPGVDESNLQTRYRQRNQVFWNDGTGGFAEASRAPGDALDEVESSRAAAFGDLDDDGDVDGVVVNIDGPVSLLDNVLDGGEEWVLLRLVGRDSPRDGVGARILVRAGGTIQEREAHPSGSFLSSSDPRVHLGLGRSGTIESLSVRWPSGREEDRGSLEPGQLVILVEGRPR